MHLQPLVLFQYDVQLNYVCTRSSVNDSIQFSSGEYFSFTALVAWAAMSSLYRVPRFEFVSELFSGQPNIQWQGLSDLWSSYLETARTILYC